MKQFIESILKKIKILTGVEKEKSDVDKAMDFYHKTLAKTMLEKEAERVRKMASLDIINFFAEDSKYRRNRKNFVTNDELVKFVEDASNRIRDVFFKIIDHVEYEQFMIFVVDKMEEFYFIDEPSINLIRENDSKNIESFVERRTLEILATINLLEHTANVVEVAVEVMERAQESFTKNEEMIILFGCLFHDFGQSIKLAEHYNENISSNLAYKLLCEFRSGLLVLAGENAKISTKIFNVLREQNKDFSMNEYDNLAIYIKSANQKARKSEIEKLTKNYI